MAEKRETAKTAFRPRPKLKKCLKNGFPIPWKWGKSFKTVFQPLGSRKADASTEFT